MLARHQLGKTDPLDARQCLINFLTLGKFMPFPAVHPVGISKKSRTASQNLFVGVKALFDPGLQCLTSKLEIPLRLLVQHSPHKIAGQIREAQAKPEQEPCLP